MSEIQTDLNSIVKKAEQTTATQSANVANTNTQNTNIPTTDNIHESASIMDNIPNEDVTVSATKINSKEYEEEVEKLIESAIEEEEKNKTKDDIKKNSDSQTAEEYALKEIEEQIAQKKAEIEAEKEARTGIGAIWDGVKGLFGKGSNGEIKELEELEELYKKASNDPTAENVEELYKAVNGTEINWDKIEEAKQTSQSLANGEIKTANGETISQEDVANAILSMAEGLDSDFTQNVESQGLISKGINLINNNILGIGQTQDMTQAQIDLLKEQVDKLSKTEDPEEFAALYKQITGEDLTQESISQLIGGESKVQNSKAAEAMMDYEQTQENGMTAFTGVVVGIATATTGPLGGAVVGALINTGLRAVDAVTQTNGKTPLENLGEYAKNDLVKDLALGAVSGLAGGVGNKASAYITGLGKAGAGAAAKIATRVGAEFVEGAADGAISNAGEYLIDVARGESEFSLKDLGSKTIEGGVFGGIFSVGMQEGASFIGGAIGAKLFKNGDTPTIKNKAVGMEDVEIKTKLDADHEYGKTFIDKDTNEMYLYL